MKVLMINKFLYPNGGSETYMFQLGRYLEGQGHSVEYFGMEHERRQVGNRAGAYTKTLDFHSGSFLHKLGCAARTVYSGEARRKLRQVLEDFEPDVCHLNNFNYQLTPSILLEIVRWRRRRGKACRIIYTAHDYQLLCPNHMFYNPGRGEVCEKCLGGHFYSCFSGKCIHGSRMRSLLGMAEGYVWRAAGVYRHLDRIICCSRFLKERMDKIPLFAGKTVMRHNFVHMPPGEEGPSGDAPWDKGEYVLYFGRYSEEKGIRLLAGACRALPDIPFVFAGSGPLKELLDTAPNIRDVGFQSGKALFDLIRRARFSIYPSIWYENCPFSVMERQLLGKRVLGAEIAGISALIGDGVSGELFAAGDQKALAEKIRELWEDKERQARYVRGCGKAHFDTVSQYGEKLLELYMQGRREDE